MQRKGIGTMANKGNDILITGARVHNLKNVDVRIPRDKLVVITGLSGSGKSSLAFDTIFAEGQRRYMETFSSYARGYIGTMHIAPEDTENMVAHLLEEGHVFLQTFPFLGETCRHPFIKALRLSELGREGVPSGVERRERRNADTHAYVLLGIQRHY